MTLLIAAALIFGQTDADKANSAKTESPAVAPADDRVEPAKTDAKNANRKAAARVLMPELMLLTALAILLLFLGGILFIRRMGEKLTKSKPRKPVKYFDMKVEPLAEEPPHEPTAEERWREPDDPRP